MLLDIEAGFRKTAEYTGRGAMRAEVRQAMEAVPRHEFARDEDAREAYENRPLPIGHGQTISQPFIVALMAELSDAGPASRVLEVGTGCGYAAAVLAEIAGEVLSVETVEALATSAARRLARLGYDKVQVRHGDGATGWLDTAPFDAIVVSAAAASIPDALVEQLATPGVMIIPVGEPGRTQQLTRVTKEAVGRVRTEELLPVAFVPLV